MEQSLFQALNVPSEHFVGPAWVTLAYAAVYYLFLLRGLVVQSRLAREHRDRGEKFDRYFSQDRQLLASDRSQLNMLEQMPIFLVLMWLHAFVVSGSEAAILGGIYTGLRVLYPIAVGRRLGRRIRAQVLPITFSSYIIIGTFAVRIATHL